MVGVGDLWLVSKARAKNQGKQAHEDLLAGGSMCQKLATPLTGRTRQGKPNLLERREGKRQEALNSNARGYSTWGSLMPWCRRHQDFVLLGPELQGLNRCEAGIKIAACLWGKFVMCAGKMEMQREIS